jgi:plastocyanin
MIARFTPTLVICALGAAVTGALFALPAATPALSTPAPAPLPPGAPTVQIADFRFALTRAPAGATVAVQNADAVPHTLTARTGAFGTGVLDGGAAGSFTAPGAPGTYEIVCELHPSMTGTLVID